MMQRGIIGSPVLVIVGGWGAVGRMSSSSHVGEARRSSRIAFTAPVPLPTWSRRGVDVAMATVEVVPPLAKAATPLASGADEE